jgi:hypothetical protein
MNKNKKDLPVVPDLKAPVPENTGEFPYEIAMVIDDVIYDVMNVDGQQAAQYMTQPKFVLFNPGEARIGWTYKDGELSYPKNNDLGV